ncbi:MAG: hypothetical protein LBL07_08515 [Tannerella sp.]|nr:hypothetical protein [Tannerella sp.]
MISISAKSQFIDYGSDPSRIKWKIVGTPHYKLIYPSTNDSAAYRYALFLEHTYPQQGKTIGMSDVRSFPVILHPGSMQSNGLVAWAPRRMELITVPSLDLDAQSWDKHLVLHESRHVLQMYKLSQGLFRPLHYVLGEQIAGISSAFIPKWFFEGDAVATETAMSNNGRGRLPEFNMRYRAQMLSGNFYSYDKWALGSYKDYTGDYYALGYDLTAYARYRYGPDVWDKVTSRYTRRFFRIPPFSKALKHVAGIDTETLFDETFRFLNKEWTGQDSVYKHSGFNRKIRYVTPETGKYTSYNYPQILDDGSMIAVKTALDEIGSLVIVKDGVEKRLCYLGSINSRIILNHNRVYWTENVSGVRWTHENYSELKYYDLTSRKIVTVTHKQRFLAPAIDKTGKIAAVSQPSFSGVNRIILLNIEDEASRKKDVRSEGDRDEKSQSKGLNGKDSRSDAGFRGYDVPFNGFVKEIAFIDEHKIAAVAVHDRGLSLFQLDLLSGRWDELTEPVSANITSLTECNGRLFFESGLNGTNNIYSFDPLTSKSIRLTASRFGAFAPAFSDDGKKLFFSDYNANGHRIASVSVDSLQQLPANFKQRHAFTLAETVAKQEHFNLDTDSLGKIDFNPMPYRKGSHLFRVHSWAPFYYDATRAVNSLSDDLSTDAYPGVMVLSQNLLSTMVSQAGVYYDNGYHHGKLSAIYRGWFPVINLSIDYGGKAFDYEWQKTGESNLAAFRKTNRDRMEAEARVYIPFDFTRNHYISGFQPSVTYSYTNNRYQQLKSGKFRQYQYLLGELRYYRYREMAHQDILPRLGYQIQLQYLNIPFDTENFGSLYAAKLTSYLPGAVRGHGLMLRMMYQYQDKDGKAFFTPHKLVSQARGYQYTYQARHKLEWKADYAFSLFCPDWSIGSVAYLKRVRSNVFYDLSKNQLRKQGGWTTQSSCGADFICDYNIFRLNIPMSTGIRIIRQINSEKIQIEGLFSVSL